MENEEKGGREVKTTLYLLIIFAGIMIASWIIVLLKLLSGGSVSG